jgi:hypothetical protein
MAPQFPSVGIRTIEYFPHNHAQLKPNQNPNSSFILPFLLPPTSFSRSLRLPETASLTFGFEQAEDVVNTD